MKNEKPQITTAQHNQDLVGNRYQIPAWCDNWMRGDRYATVTSVRASRKTGKTIVYLTGDLGTKTRLQINELMGECIPAPKVGAV